LTACLSARRTSPPRWATRITPVILTCSGLSNRASAAFARRERRPDSGRRPGDGAQSAGVGANFVAVGVDTNLYTSALDKRLAMFKPVAEQAEERELLAPGAGAGVRPAPAPAG
jgi:hypothetical protein